MSGIEQAAKALGITEHTVRLLMEQCVIDIGYVAHRKGGRKTYIVIPELLAKEVERLGKSRET